MYKCVKGLAPEYLIDIVITSHRRRLRSTTELKLPVIKSRTDQVHLWDQEFGMDCQKNLKEAASIEQFKSLMKTHLFKLCYI